MKFIDDIRRRWWRLWSVRLNALGLILLTWGELPLSIWQMMPGEVRAILPGHWATALAGLAFGAATIARLIRQDKLNAKS